MRFSEGMLLVMSTSKLAPRHLAADGCVCALGAAYCSFGWIDANGKWLKKTADLTPYEIRVVDWLNADTNGIPCGCSFFNGSDDALLLIGHNRAIIAHIFNRHVMGDKTWTPEKLVDYVRTIEPAEIIAQGPNDDQEDDSGDEQPIGDYETGIEMERSQHGDGGRYR